MNEWIQGLESECHSQVVLKRTANGPLKNVVFLGKMSSCASATISDENHEPVRNESAESERALRSEKRVRDAFW